MNRVTRIAIACSTAVIALLLAGCTSRPVTHLKPPAANGKRVVLVHGFGSPVSGRYDIDRLRPYFERAGYEVIEFDYGFRLFVLRGNERWAKRLAAMVRPGDIGVGHSNGCLVLAKASLRGAPFSQLVFLAPALDVDAKVGPQVKRIHVWHARTDLATRFAGLFPKHPWGPMGSVGYQGSDPRFINYDRGDRSKYDPVSLTHLDFMYVTRIRDYFGPLIVSGLESGSRPR